VLARDLGERLAQLAVNSVFSIQYLLKNVWQTHLPWRIQQ